jgi:hypothetical protein
MTTTANETAAQNAEQMFVAFINDNSDKVKALAAIMAMSDEEKLALIKEFEAK